jgi:hypothetical protein
VRRRSRSNSSPWRKEKDEKDEKDKKDQGVVSFFVPFVLFVPAIAAAPAAPPGGRTTAAGWGYSGNTNKIAEHHIILLASPPDTRYFPHMPMCQA